jgi:hypothetical protein
MRVTTRSLISALTQSLRGNRDYAVNLLRLVGKHGNVPLALLYMPIHVLFRLYNYVTAKPSYGAWLPPEPGMGTPSLWEEPLADHNGSIQRTAAL